MTGDAESFQITTCSGTVPSVPRDSRGSHISSALEPVARGPDEEGTLVHVDTEIERDGQRWKLRKNYSIGAWYAELQSGEDA